jgi:hypothetical protein
MIRGRLPRCLLFILTFFSCLGLGDAPCPVVKKEEFHLPPAPKLYDCSESIPLDFDVYVCAKYDVSGRSASFEERKGASTTSSSDTTNCSQKACSDHSRLLRGSSKSSKGKYSRRKLPLVIFACGTAADESVYTMFGGTRGFAIALINKPRRTPLPPGGPVVTMNAAIPYCFVQIMKSSKIMASLTWTRARQLLVGAVLVALSRFTRRPSSVTVSFVIADPIYLTVEKICFRRREGTSRRHLALGKVHVSSR